MAISERERERERETDREREREREITAIDGADKDRVVFRKERKG